MEWNYEGYIDSYGIPVFDTPKQPVDDPHGTKIKIGVVEYWQNEVDGLKGDQDGFKRILSSIPQEQKNTLLEMKLNHLYLI